MSLLNRILVLIFMILLLITGIDLVEGINARSEEQEQLKAHAVSLARATALDIERTFEGGHQLLAGLSQTQPLQAHDRKACDALLTQVQHELAMYDFIAINEIDGSVVCRSNPDKGVNVRGNPWQIATTVATGEFVVGAYSESTVRHTQVVRMSYPVKAADGSVARVLVAGLDLHWLNAAIAALQLQADAVISVLDRNGTVIARAPEANFTGTQVPEAMRPNLNAETAGTSTRAGLDGVVRIYGYAPVRIGTAGRIFVTVGFDRGVALSAIDRAMWRKLAFDFAVLFAAALAALLYVRRFVDRPLRRLLARAERWESGDWTRHARVASGIAQFDRLTEAFDAMAETVATRQASLEVAAASLLKNREHLARAQHVARIGSFEYDLATGSLQGSDETYRILGLTPGVSPLSYAGFQAMILPEDRAVDESAAFIRAGLSVHTKEFRLRRPDGEIRTLYRETEPVLDAAGKPLKILGIVRDVTELREAERQRDAFEKQFHQAQKMEALGTLAGGIAHDLNNALVPVIVFSNILLKNTSEGTPEHDRLALIDDGAQRARSLVQRILTFGRKDEVDRQPIDLLQFATRALKMLRPTLPSTITIGERFEPVAPVLADEGQLHQVLMNLLTNAAYSLGAELGAITIEIAPGPDPAPGAVATVRLSVVDTGCGMDAETRQRLFEPFFTTKPVNEGTGLGLAVVHGIVTKHGGTISVDSEIDKGTRFDVYLPVLDGAAAAPQRDAA
jgi:signal transduction histidine kinase